MTLRAETADGAATRHRRWRWLVGLAVVFCGGYALLAASATRPPSSGDGSAARPTTPGVPVVVAAAREGDLPVYLTGLGWAAAFNTVTVKSRVDGQLVKVVFEEGQFVHEGDLLAEVDPRPFEVQRTQAEGQLARDLALLKDAQLNLARFHELHAAQVVSTQELDDQAAKVGQYEGAIKADQGLVDNAKLQLTYSHITAPISGRAGLRLVDVGNVVHANDQSGLVVITQLQPIAVLFTIPEDDLPPVMRKLAAGERPRVEAFDRAGQIQIATGSLLTADNQIDQNTGMTKLKAIFQNQDGALFPNQFVNVRLLLDVQAGVVIVPVAAIQRGPGGAFVYLVRPDQSVEVRQVTLGPTAGSEVAVAGGLSAKEIVVVDGVEKLRAGSTVRVKPPEAAAAAPSPSA